MSLKPGDLVPVRIEKMSLHGGGLARVQGLVVFIEFAAPGDELLVEIIEVKKNVAFARIQEIRQASTERKNPPCPVFGKCGGCNWQHLTEESQRTWKQSLVQEALIRAWGKEIHFEPFFQGPQAFRYRNRIQLKKQGSAIGYFEKASHRLVSIADCWLAETPLLTRFPELRQKPAGKETQNWEIALTQDGSTTLTTMEDRDLDFSQVNRFVNDVLVNETLSWAAATDFKFYWDLYCGSGNFSFPLAEKFPKATGLAVEWSGSSIQKAQAETRTRGWSPKRLEFFRADVAKFLHRQSPAAGSLVLLDPPRAGLDSSVVTALAHSQAATLLYISCDPMTLARDLKRLREARPGHWQLVRARCFDMFPQTDHVETLVELRAPASPTGA